ncbi:u-box domain-containing protein [Echria macrotheca]|uniref:U-box domain-containing protein n=1 Tax=Echria macrotheca TaxID=438768 RepID=A0AAJ0FAG7_9PEZI|nr:u-box domain-containing protein [Echria macrotheca]
MVRKRLPSEAASDSSVIFTDSGSDEDTERRWANLRATLPIREKNGSATDRLGLEIHPFDSTDGLLIRVLPPREPVDTDLEHVPCDIVLVIDVSGSMDCEAPLPGNPGETKERYGLSVLDLTKHAANTILESLNENDRLGIVTFAAEPEVVQKLTRMTPANKRRTRRKIENMRTKDITNLWGGIREGLTLFDGGDSTGNVPALMVLTDGLPNHKCPSQGYVPKLRSVGQLPATIHTFGFGFSLRSGLLKSIAEIGGGNYSFIPDAGMIGTIFVHAVANLQSTYATNAVLRLKYPGYLGLEETTGESVDKEPPIQMDGVGPDAPKQLTISLSSIQYGHSRDIYLKYSPDFRNSLTTKLAEDSRPVVTAVLEYQPPISVTESVTAARNILEPSSSLSPAEIVYHKSRSAMVAFLSSLYPIRPDGEHEHPRLLPEDTADKFEAFLRTFPASAPEYQSDPLCQSLVKDLAGPMRTGQVALALSTEEYYKRWGKHYLPSLAGAHARQACNSFKDPGPLMYGLESPLFIRCRDRLDTAFDALPAPKPSRKTNYQGKIRMSAYNRSSNPCFAGCSMVALAPPSSAGLAKGSAARMIRIGGLRAGMSVMTPKGPRRVVAVLRTSVRRERLCLVGNGVLVTPWHPVLRSRGEGWVFPNDVAMREVSYTGSIYSVLLQRDADVDAHAIKVGGLWGVTLGHGKTGQSGQTGHVRDHSFLGDYDRVVKALGRLHTSRSGLVFGGGVKRCARTGLVNGFKRVSDGQVRNALRMGGIREKSRRMCAS